MAQEHSYSCVCRCPPLANASKRKFRRWTPAFAGALALLVTCNSPANAQNKEQNLTPDEILAATPADQWLSIPVNDLMVLTLPNDAQGNPRSAVIQLLPAGLSGGHVRNVRALAKARWWDGTKVYRVAADFVTQFGGNADNKTLPANLETVPESEYFNAALGEKRDEDMKSLEMTVAHINEYQDGKIPSLMDIIYEGYGARVGFGGGWPIGTKDGQAFPITCRGSLSPAHYASPDTGSGAEISVITGEAARNLDTTFGFVGRVIDGLEHLIDLPPGEGAGGFYEDKTKLIPIQSIRLASELPVAEQPHYEYLTSYSPSLLQYLAAHDKRGNICTAPYPIRKITK